MAIEGNIKPEGKSAGIDEAIALATEAFSGKKDLDGNPAVLHALAVGDAGSSVEERIVGYLHDIVEDTDMTFEDLEKMGFSRSVIEALRLCTRDRDIPYEEYVRRIIDSGNSTALNVKINDLSHNIARGRKTLERALAENDAEVTAKITRINAKHEKALEYIKSR